jgi:hypothetical protein
MKKIFALAVATVLTVSAAWAQDYTRLQASYVTHRLKNAEVDDKDIEPKGVTLGAVLGFSVTDELPIFVESGANLTWAHGAMDVTGGEVKSTYMNFAVPVNGVYKFEINDKVAISGFAGLNFKVNFLAKTKAYGNKTNWLSKDDMGGRDNRAKVFQLGCQFGAGVHLGQVYLGYEFQPDLMNFQKYDYKGADAHKWLANYITVGFTIE